MEQMTVRDVIEVTRRELSRVMIPAEMVDAIGIPIRNALHNLKQCTVAIDREMAQAEQQQEEPVEVELFGGDGESMGTFKEETENE